MACAMSCVLAAAAGPALAQHVWLDEKGVKQYSDQPAPAGVPARRVLQSAAPRPAAPQESSGPTLAERNAEFEKRRIEKAERESKEIDQARLEQERSRNCEQARAYSRALANGDRVSRVDANGERSYLTDAQRAQEAAQARKILEQCKAGA
jgi:hypothetical protein